MIFFFLVGILFNATRIGPLTNLVNFITNWGVFATLINAASGIILGNNPSYSFKVAPNLHALYHLTYTLMLFLNPIIVCVYWGLIHTDHMEEIAREHPGDKIMQEAKI